MWATSGRSCSRSRSAAMPSGRTSGRTSHAISALGGTTHSSVSNGRSFGVWVEPRVELDGADRDALRSQVVDGGDDRSGDVVSRLRLVPIGRAVVGPVRRTRTDRVGPATRAHGAGGVEQHPAPGVECRPRAVGREHGEVGREAGWHGFQIAVPAATQRSAVQTDGLLVKRVEGSDEKRPAVASGEQQGPAGGGSVREKEPVVERRSGIARKRELAVLEDEGAQVLWCLTLCPLGWREGRPGDRGLVERAGRDVGEVGGRFAAEHEQRAIDVGPDRAAHVTVDDSDRRGGAQVVDRRDGLADAGWKRGPTGSEPILPVESDLHRAVGRDVHAQSICCGQEHERSLSKRGK